MSGDPAMDPAMEARPLGVTVLGSGRAARARRAAIASLPTCAHAEYADADAAIVCSANADHFEQARQALNDGKHVAVEFPLCATAAEARELLELAADRARVLHLEVISLLSAGVTGAGRATEPVVSRFTGGAYRWVSDEIRAGRLGQLAVGRLHVLWRLAGPLRLVSVQGGRDADGYRLEARLRGAVDVRLVEQRGPGLRRGWTLTVGEARVPGARRDERLFERDTAAFIAAVRREAPSYVGADEILAVAELAEAISAAVSGSR